MMIDFSCMPIFSFISMQEVEDRLPSELSGGMKKRVALARSIIFDTTKDVVEPEVCYRCFMT